MLFGINLTEILMFPLKDAEARKHFLIATLVVFVSFIIPIVPYLALLGYAALIAQQVLRGETPRMIPWEDWGGMLTNGLKLFGARLIYSLPIILLVAPIMIASFVLPFVATEMNSRDAETLVILTSLVIFGSMCFIVPVSLVLGVIIPVAEVHVVEKGEFAAAFQLKAWWSIFRANVPGFIAAIVIYYIASMLLGIIMQILVATFILACLLIIFVPAMTAYLTLVMYAAVAIAYRDGREKLAQTA
ncbi:MAG: DUF4013 domain-containing protein [Anaerolineales bacterium]|nr:MAG: DUF4013 domain-containing protein [Anaerolineales bacterium]